MKKFSILLSGLLLAGAGFTSCDNDQVLPPIAYPDGGSAETIGTGDWDNPFSVWQVLAGVKMGEYENGAARETVWVTGYIVGYINTFDGDYAKLREKSAVFSAEGAPNSNLLLAMTPDETDWERCIPVQLAYGTSGRDLSLANHPEYLHREVTLRGTTGANYLSVYGLRNCDNYNWGPEGVYIAPPEVFQRANEIVDGGQYVMVAGGKYIAKPVTEGYSYGYFYVAESNAGQTVTTEADYVFTFTKEGDYWIIKDSYGRYVYQNASAYNFQVGLEMPTENYLWNVEFNDNGQAIITNVSRNTWIQYDPNYTSYGCYNNERGDLPVLYVRAVDGE